MGNSSEPEAEAGPEPGPKPGSGAPTPSLNPARREWNRPAGSRGDVDSARRGRMIKAFGWAAFPGLMIGAVLIPMIGVFAILVGLLIIAGVGGAAYAMSEGVGGAAAVALNPAAGSRGVRNSRAEALLAQGRAQEAVDEWEMTALEHPDDSRAPSAVARIHRDYLDQPEDAVRWFKKALRAAGGSSEARVLMRELVGVAGKLSDQGASAAPELARYASANEGNPEGEWASRELGFIKEAMAQAEQLESDRGD